MVTQKNRIRIILLYFCRSNKKVYGFCFLGSPHIYIYRYIYILCNYKETQICLNCHCYINLNGKRYVTIAMHRALRFMLFLIYSIRE